MAAMAVTVPPDDVATTIQVRGSTRSLLESRKTGAQTYDDVILDLIEEDPTEAQIREFERRLKGKEPDVPWEETRKKVRR